MPILIFILLGVVCGYIAVGLFKSTGLGVVFDIGLGVIGAVIAGAIFNRIAVPDVAGLNTASALIAALTGAAALLATFHGLRDGRNRASDAV